MKTLLKGEKRRTAIATALTVVLGVVLYEILEHFGPVRSAVSAFAKVVAPILYGLCVAFVLNLPMSFFENRVFKKLKAKKPKLTRALCVLITYVLVLGVIALISSLVVPKVVGSIITLVSNLDVYISFITEHVNKWTEELNLSPEAYSILEKVFANLMQRINNFAVNFLPKIPRLTVSVIGVLYSVLVTMVISVHTLIRKEKIQRFAEKTAAAIIPAEHFKGFMHYASYANTTFKRYITGQLASCIIIGVLCYIGMRIFRMPYPELISVFICLAALIPIIGPWASTVPSALIILMTRQDNPWLALWFVLMIIGIQAIDDNLVYPRIVGDAVGIPGMLVLAAIVVAGGLFGVGGLLVAVPTAAVIYRIFGDWVKKRNAAKQAEQEKKQKLDEAMNRDTE